jgi:hypothetical protein
MLRNFINIIGIADPSEFPIITTSNPNTEHIVEETLTIPEAKPDVEQINTILIEAKLYSSRVIVTPTGLKVIIDGQLDQKIIYTAAEPTQPVHAAHFIEQFCSFIEIPVTVPAGISVQDYLQTLGLTLDTVLTAPTKVLIEDVTASLLDPRTIEKCTVLFLWATISPLLVPVPLV